jgi:CBS domain-containing protein
MTKAVYASVDAFARLPIHWMWWPAIGGIAIGVGGWIFPQALGVGYDTIGQLLQGEVPHRVILGILVVKASIWAIALGSGTSGGVLAPLLMMGGALGGVEAMWLPALGAGFWPLVSMAAILGGTMRSPFTGIVFAIELTHDVNMILPLLVAVTIAHLFTVLVLKRSILTEKISRRGYHLTREYAIDPLEILFVREVMRTPVIALPAGSNARQVHDLLHPAGAAHGRQRLYPVVDAGQRLVTVVTRVDLDRWLGANDGLARLDEVRGRTAMVAYMDERLSAVVYRMARTGLTRFPVVERASHRVVGMVSLSDLLQGRRRTLDAEHRRERVRAFGWSGAAPRDRDRRP